MIIELARMEMRPRYRVENGAVQEVEMAAFVGATDDRLAQFGIGLVDRDGNCHFWALAMPHALITSWRGMQVLDQVQALQHSTIHDAYHVGQRKRDDEVEKAISKLWEQIPHIEKLREELLQKAVPDDELDRMLAICNSPDNSIDLTVRELQEELAAGTIHETAELTRTFQIDQAERERYEADKARSQQPLPPEQSFCKFCLDAEIKYLCDQPVGAYGWDWGYVKLEELDELIVYDGLRFNGSIYLACAEFPAESEEFGNVGAPVIRLNDGRELILSRARYHDDQMWAVTSAVKESDESTEWKLATLAALEPKMVGVTFVMYDNATVEDMQRGYIAINRTHKPSVLGQIGQFWQKLTK